MSDDRFACVHCGANAHEGFKRRRSDFRWECVNVAECDARRQQAEAEEDLT